VTCGVSCCNHRAETSGGGTFGRELSWGDRLNALWRNTRTQDVDIGYMDKVTTLIDFKMI